MNDKKEKSKLRVILEDILLLFIPGHPEGLKEWTNLSIGIAFAIIIMLFVMAYFTANL